MSDETAMPGVNLAGFKNHINHDLNEIVSHPTHIKSKVDGLISYINEQLPVLMSDAANQALAKVETPVSEIQVFFNDAQSLVSTITNEAMQGVESTGQTILTHVETDFQRLNLGNRAEQIGQKLQQAEQAALLDISSLSSKVKNELHSLENVDAVVKKIESDLQNVGLGTLKSLYSQHAIAGAGSVYKRELGQLLDQVKLTGQQLDQKLPVHFIPLDLIDPLKRILDIIPNEMLDLLAGVLPVKEIDSVVTGLESVINTLENGHLSKDAAKGLIVASATLRSLGIAMKELSYIVPVAIQVGEQTSVAAEEEAGAGVAAAVRVGAQGKVAEGGGASAGVTVFKVGVYVCRYVYLVLDGLATALDLVRKMYPVK